MTSDDLRHFITDILGCHCPPEVLTDISSETDLSGGPLYESLCNQDTGLSLMVDRIIAVGGRLLAMVTRVDGEDEIRLMLEAGGRLRAELDFKRLRLVVCGPKPDKDVSHRLLGLCGENQHLHFIDIPVTGEDANRS